MIIQESIEKYDKVSGQRKVGNEARIDAGPHVNNTSHVLLEKSKGRKLKMGKKRRDLLSIKEAAEFAGKSESNIQYLIQYGRINKYNAQGKQIGNSTKTNQVRVLKNELKEYLKKRGEKVKSMRKEEIGEYDERLAFDELTEKERTKHVHRLHPYKGKFIPQLVEFFLKRYFEKGQIILDPFVGSGTTLVQANELGMNSIGIDISPFNCLISEVKTSDYDIKKLEREITGAVNKVEAFSSMYFGGSRAKKMRDLLSEFNNGKMRKLKEKYGAHNELKEHAEEKFYRWIKKRGDEDLLVEKEEEVSQSSLSDFDPSDFETEREYLNEWFANRSLKELLYYRTIISEYEHEDVLKIILSRAARSVRLVPHYDLTSPDEPVRKPYYCYKHYKICMPLRTVVGKLRYYSKDTIRRIKEFSKLKSDDCFVRVIQGDSRRIKMEKYFEEEFFDKNKIDGVFTSPPYVGNIDYHEQHRYAYELLDIPRHDRKEIGPKFRGKSKKARDDYKKGISQTLINLRGYMSEDSLILFVANDKYNLYPDIAENAGMEIVEEYKRPVSKRAERDRRPYSEKIFQMVFV